MRDSVAPSSGARLGESVTSRANADRPEKNVKQIVTLDLGNGEDRLSRSEALHRVLANDILSGAIPPGAKLDEVSIATRFSVSRTPVREALQYLVASGLATKEPHRGVVVAEINRKRLHDMFEVMADMEALCAAYAAERMTPAERNALERLHHDSSSMVRSGDHETYEAFNIEFHSAIYRGAHNEYLEEAALSIRQRLKPFRGAQFRLEDRLSLSYEEHDEIVTAILRGNADRARETMRAHVTVVGEVSEYFAIDEIAARTSIAG